MRRTFREGFTLIEILVAVAVLVVLIALLMSGVGRVREAANRTVCRNNLRTTGQAFLIYARDYEDAVPLASGSLNKQSNYWYYNGDPGLGPWGLLYQAGLIVDPRSTFCPAQNDPLFRFNTEANPWPPKVGGPRVRAGYSMRASYRFAYITVPPRLQFDRFLTSDPPTFADDVPCPKLKEFEGKVIISDMIRTPDVRLSSHLEGIDFLRADGSTGFAADAVVGPLITQLHNPFSTSDNPVIDQIWGVLDTK